MSKQSTNLRRVLNCKQLFISHDKKTECKKKKTLMLRIHVDTYDKLDKGKQVGYVLKKSAKLSKVKFSNLF